LREEPCGRDRRASEIEYLFSVSFPLVGNPSDCSGSQERFWTSQNDRNKELRQRPQGVKFIKVYLVLAENNFISEDSLRFLIPMAGTRNVLVHGYDKIDDAIIFGVLKKYLSDFYSFLKEIEERYLTKITDD
jgi:hypothetical protein